MKHVKKSAKLANVCYDIRGPVLQKAKQMEEEGHKIIKLNIGNLAAFGFDSPEEIQQDIIRNLPNAAGYTDSKGIFAARKAIMHYTQQKGIKGVTLEDIYVGNGVSELIVMAMNALLDADGEHVKLTRGDLFGHDDGGAVGPVAVSPGDFAREHLVVFAHGDYVEAPACGVVDQVRG